MVEQNSTRQRFLPTIATAKGADPYSDPKTRDGLVYKKDGAVEVYYSPFDHIAHRAKLVIVGITPGRAQAINAAVAARVQIQSGRSTEDALRAAKLTASFSGGGTRNNLVRMMDSVGLNALFNIVSTASLFTEAGEQVHFTSALRYPVFVKGENYNGNPHMLKTPVLRDIIETYLAEEARALQGAVWLPLGPKPAIALQHLAGLGLLRPEQILDGMPHPSGANAERVAAFLGTKPVDQLSTKTNATQIMAAKQNLIEKIGLLKSQGGVA
ncbi:hypothetical protein [Agrobacterium sp.]|uniref:hypothetical protein n=1 Tax=Rhizobium/Agrobacterium group TaxID=227290 RepID=UPI0025BA0D77|nr:hypothetical protein [Agrobacterium sp.]MCD4659766.1 hypothetical protein [Agrobacterium sp.]